MSSGRLLAADTANGTDDTRVSTDMPPKLTSRKNQLFALVAFLCFGYLLVWYILHTQPEFNQYGILKAYNGKLNQPNAIGRPKTILLWNRFFGDSRWSLPGDTLGPEYFREIQCPVVNCELTNNKDFLPGVEMFDAVVFHVAESFPFLQPIPRRRDPAQQYVFALMEPPGETKHVLGDEKRFYNLTMTYRLDSDILWPYMFLEDIDSRAIVAPALNPPWRRISEGYNGDEELMKLVAGKTKFAAWFVSHCETLSKREQLTNSLQQYVDVDVYGACGTLKCPRNSSKCDRMIDNDYKFYFAFENGLCQDYVTEKFYNTLSRQVIPVVFGGADYKRFAPPHSYINAEDFKSVEDLANYLTYISNNPKEYARYFWWRQHYRIKVVSPFCDLCTKLNAPGAMQKVQFYDDIENWWLGNSCYFEPKILL